LRRKVLLVTFVLLALVGIAAVANASVTGGCTGSAVVDGITYGPNNDTAANPIVIPLDKSGVTAAWEGSVPFQNTNDHGTASMVFGPWTVQIAEWGGANSEDKRSASGTYSLDDLTAKLPVSKSLVPAGLYEVTVTHAADGGQCKGTVMVQIKGDLLSSPVGIGTVAGTVVTGLMLIGSAFARRP